MAATGIAGVEPESGAIRGALDVARFLAALVPCRHLDLESQAELVPGHAHVGK